MLTQARGRGGEARARHERKEWRAKTRGTERQKGREGLKERARQRERGAGDKKRGGGKGRTGSYRATIAKARGQKGKGQGKRGGGSSLAKDGGDEETKPVSEMSWHGTSG